MFPPLPSSAEINRRLEIVSQLRNLCLSLGQARPSAEADRAGACCEQTAGSGEPQNGRVRLTYSRLQDD